MSFSFLVKGCFSQELSILGSFLGEEVTKCLSLEEIFLGGTSPFSAEEGVSLVNIFWCFLIRLHSWILGQKKKHNPRERIR